MRPPFFSFFGEPTPGRKAPLVNVYDYALTEDQYAELGYAYNQYRLQRQPDILRYAYKDLELSDGSRVRFTSIDTTDIIDVWPAGLGEPEEPPAGIGLLMTDLDGFPVDGMKRPDGYGSFEPAPMLLQQVGGQWRATQLTALRGGRLLHVGRGGRHWSSAHDDGKLAYQHNMTLLAMHRASPLCPPFTVLTPQGTLLCHAVVEGSTVKLWMGTWRTSPGLDNSTPRDPQDYIGPGYFELDAGTPLCEDRPVAVSPDGTLLLVTAQDEQRLAEVDVSSGDARLSLRDPGLTSVSRQLQGGEKTVSTTLKRLPNAYALFTPVTYAVVLDLEQASTTTYQPFEATKTQTFLDHPLILQDGSTVLCARTVERHWRYEGSLGSVWRVKPAGRELQKTGNYPPYTFPCTLTDSTENLQSYGFSEDTRIDLAGYTFQRRLVSYDVTATVTKGSSYTWMPPHVEVSGGPLVPASKIYASDPNAKNEYAGTIEHTDRKLLAHDADLGLVAYAELSIKIQLDGSLTGDYASDESALRLVVVLRGDKLVDQVIAPVRRGPVGGTLPDEPTKYAYSAAIGSSNSYVARSVFGETICPVNPVGGNFQGYIYDIASPDGTTITAGWDVAQVFATQASISYADDIVAVNNMLREVGLAYGPGIVGGNRVVSPQDAKASWNSRFLDGTYFRVRVFYNSAWPNGGGTYVEGSAPIIWHDYATITKYGTPGAMTETFYDTPLLTVSYDAVAHPTPPLDLVSAHTAKDPVTGAVALHIDFDGPSLGLGVARASWSYLADRRKLRTLQSVLPVPETQALRLADDSSHSLVSV